MPRGGFWRGDDGEGKRPETFEMGYFVLVIRAKGLDSGIGWIMAHP